MINASQDVPIVYRRIVDVFKELGVTLTAGLPDDWVAPLLDLLDAEPGIVNLRVAREPEVIGICSGSFFAGAKTVGIMGATGFLTCISELATVNLKYQIPLFMVVSLRGSIYDHQAFQEVQGRLLLRQFDALGLPYLELDEPNKIDHIADAFVHSRIQKRPYVLGLAKSLLMNSAEGS